MNSMYIVGPILNISFGMILIYGTYMVLKYINDHLNDEKGVKMDENEE